MDRNRRLDGLRGLAAVAVAIGHCDTSVSGVRVLMMDYWALATASYSEIVFRLIHNIFHADGAVIVFFVLSGHVLWLSLRNRSNLFGGIAPYVIRRTFRLLPTSFVAAALIGFTLHAPLGVIVSNALFADLSLNGVVWSLRVEVWGSVLVLAMALCWRHAQPVAAALAIVVVGISLFVTWENLYFLIGFLFGMTLDSIPRRISTSRPFAAACLISFLFVDLFLPAGFGLRLVMAMLAAGFVAHVAHQGPRFLEGRVAQFFGDVSYPFYLLHPFVMLLIAIATPGLERGFPPLVVFALLASATVVGTSAVSWVVHRLVELPGIALGRFVARLLSGLKLTPASI